jgi:hypothetical protein
MLPILLLLATVIEANPAQVYQQSLQMAANGQEAEAIAALQGSASVLPDQHIWKTRMLAAATLLEVKRQRQDQVPAQTGGIANLALASGYAKANPPPEAEASWPVVLLAVVLPGAGHAWQGRWHDARAAAMLAWPMLLLTLWAARRRMGPVTVFFAMITVWLWSGTVFSSISLAERSTYEAYSLWWQGYWQASGLPGRPW